MKWKRTKSLVWFTLFVLSSFLFFGCKDNNVDKNRAAFEDGGGSSSVTSSKPTLSSPSPSNGSTVSKSSSGSHTFYITVSGATSCRIYYDDDSNISFSQTGSLTTMSGKCYAKISYSSGKLKSSGKNYWYVTATNSRGTTRYPSSSYLTFTTF